MNSLVTALPGLVPIFVSAGGVNALAGVLFPMVKNYGHAFKRYLYKMKLYVKVFFKTTHDRINDVGRYCMSTLYCV